MASPSTSPYDADYLLVGGGLQNALILLAVATRKPDATVLLLERGSVIGGNHIWSFQALDLPESALDWAAPIIEYEWPGYQLHFDDSARWVAGAYRSLSSEHLHRLVTDAAAASERIELRLGVEVATLNGETVTLADGARLRGRVVVDARGPEAGKPMGSGRFSGGYQKFVGLECRLRTPTPLDAPILMDSRCAQRDGFRFHYVLPFAPDRVLIEDTYFSNAPDLDVEALSAGILAEAPRLASTSRRCCAPRSACCRCRPGAPSAPAATTRSLEDTPAAGSTRAPATPWPPRRSSRSIWPASRSRRRSAPIGTSCAAVWASRATSWPS
jgi:lycopene beta-cyclase